MAGEGRQAGRHSTGVTEEKHGGEAAQWRQKKRWREELLIRLPVYVAGMVAAVSSSETVRRQAASGVKKIQ